MKSDQQLTQDVCDELHWEPAVQAARIQVQARSGLVCLRGELSSAAECWSADRAARRVAGVQALDLRLTVRCAVGGMRQDGDIAHAARNVLAWLVGPPVHTVQVAVLGGCVHLTGHVPAPWQRPVILGALRLLPGVQSLSDGMQDAPGLACDQPPGPDGRPIEAAIRRRFANQAARVRVQVQGSGVTLSGQVGSRADRELATHAAWGTPGVRSVHDRLQLIA
jgi:osmotically-inducible protein OsmY